jgi:homoserine kinase
MKGLERATAFAPASVGNVAVGFDVLGHAVAALGDHVTVRRVPEPHVRIATVVGAEAPLPLEVERNTAGMALDAMRRALALPFGFEARVEKGIPLSAGLGGSAASAVAAVVAANALLDEPLAPERLLAFAVRGEAVASGSAHADNVAPSLLGGLVIALGGEAPRAVRVPVPPGVRCVLARPHVRVDTRAARAVLAPAVDRAAFVAQTANLAGFLAGCYAGDLGLLGACLADVVIEPQRRALVPGFDRVKAAALAAGALGCSISGAGPTLFAWCDEPRAEGVRAAMAAAFAGSVPGVDTWVSPVAPEGARVVGAACAT